GRNTIKRVLAENGIDPAGRRSMSWKTFLKAHWVAIAATDFFTIEGTSWKGLVRYFVLFVIDLKTRRIEIAGIVTSPSGTWMHQIARNWTDSEDGFLLRSRYLIHDRDPLFTKDVPRNARELGSPSREAPEPEPESERVCGAIRSID